MLTLVNHLWRYVSLLAPRASLCSSPPLYSLTPPPPPPLTSDAAEQFGFVLMMLIGSVFYIITLMLTKAQVDLALKGMTGADASLESLKKFNKFFIPMKVFLDVTLTWVPVLVAFGLRSSPAAILGTYQFLQTFRCFSIVVALGQVTFIKRSVVKAFAGVNMDGEQGLKIKALKDAMLKMVTNALKAIVLQGGSCICVAWVGKLYGLFGWVLSFQYILCLMVCSTLFKLYVPKKKASTKVANAAGTTTKASDAAGTTTSSRTQSSSSS